MKSADRASTCRVDTCPRSRSTHWPKGKKLSSTISTMDVASHRPSRCWATLQGIRCVHGFTHFNHHCTRVVIRSDGLTRPLALKQAAVISLCKRQKSANAVARKLGMCNRDDYVFVVNLRTERYAAPGYQSRLIGKHFRRPHRPGKSSTKRFLRQLKTRTRPHPTMDGLTR